MTTSDPLTPDEARERMFAAFADTPQNRLINLLVNCHRMTHRDAWNLLKFLGSSEDFAAGFVTWPALLAAGERAAKLEAVEEWERFCDHDAQIAGRRKTGRVTWRLTDPEAAP